MAPYPDGSLWMEAPGPRSQYFQQHSAALAAANADGDNSSVGFQSVQSMWRNHDGGAGAGVGGHSVSLLSSSEDYSVKTASHVLQAPTRTKTKPSKVIAKMRRQNMRKPSSSAEGFPIYQSGADVPAIHYMSIAGESVHAPGQGSGVKPPRSPVTVHLSSPFPVAPSPLSLGSSSYLLNNAPLMRSNLLMAGSGTQKAQPFTPAISVSGQGFVAPLVLPKL
jgi:hypothetical protein